MDFSVPHMPNRASLVAQTVKNLPAVWETWVQSLVWEDLLKKELPTHSSILAWRILKTEDLGGLQSMGLQRVEPEQLVCVCAKTRSHTDTYA